MAGISPMRFFEQDRATTTTTSKAITTIATTIAISGVNCDFIGTVVEAMVVTADGNFADAVVRFMALVEQIDPSEPENMTVSSAFEWSQA